MSVTKNKTKDMPLVYFVKNKALPGLYKIGRAKNFKDRLKQLSNTNLPFCFEVEKIILCTEDTYCDMEKMLHTHFKDQRVNESREFFKITSKDIDKVIKEKEYASKYKIFSSIEELEKISDEKNKEEEFKHYQIWFVDTKESKIFGKFSPMNDGDIELAKQMKVYYEKNPSVKLNYTQS